MKIGIMGGTFDPIHSGHIMLGEYAYREYELDEVWFMPNGNPPHKLNSNIESDAALRSAMTELAISGHPYFRLNTFEVEQKGISYSYKTMEYLCEKYDQDRFYFIVGADSLFAMETWAYPERLFAACTVLAACRDEDNTETLMQEKIHKLNRKFGADIRLLRTPLVPISSSELRRKIKRGEPITGLVPEAVETFIAENGLYIKEG